MHRPPSPCRRWFRPRAGARGKKVLAYAKAIAEREAALDGRRAAEYEAKLASIEKTLRDQTAASFGPPDRWWACLQNRPAPADVIHGMVAARDRRSNEDVRLQGRMRQHEHTSEALGDAEHGTVLATHGHVHDREPSIVRRDAGVIACAPTGPGKRGRRPWRRSERASAERSKTHPPASDSKARRRGRPPEVTLR